MKDRRLNFEECKGFIKRHEISMPSKNQFVLGVFGDKAAQQAMQVEEATMQMLQDLAATELIDPVTNEPDQRAKEAADRAALKFADFPENLGDASKVEPWQFHGFTEQQWDKMPRTQKRSLIAVHKDAKQKSDIKNRVDKRKGRGRGKIGAAAGKADPFGGGGARGAEGPAGEKGAAGGGGGGGGFALPSGDSTDTAGWKTPAGTTGRWSSKPPTDEQSDQIEKYLGILFTQRAELEESIAFRTQPPPADRTTLEVGRDGKMEVGKGGNLQQKKISIPQQDISPILRNPARIAELRAQLEGVNKGVADLSADPPRYSVNEDGLLVPLNLPPKNQSRAAKTEGYGMKITANGPRPAGPGETDELGNFFPAGVSPALSDKLLHGPGTVGAMLQDSFDFGLDPTKADKAISEATGSNNIERVDDGKGGKKARFTKPSNLEFLQSVLPDIGATIQGQGIGAKAATQRTVENDILDALGRATDVNKKEPDEVAAWIKNYWKTKQDSIARGNAAWGEKREELSPEESTTQRMNAQLKQLKSDQKRLRGIRDEGGDREQRGAVPVALDGEAGFFSSSPSRATNVGDIDMSGSAERERMVAGSKSAAGSSSRGETGDKDDVAERWKDFLAERELKRQAVQRTTFLEKFREQQAAFKLKSELELAAHEAEGRRVPGFNTGGVVSGTSGVDNVPAMLTSGEYVMRRGAVNKYGSAFFDSLNMGGGAKMLGGVSHFAQGGKVEMSSFLSEFNVAIQSLSAGLGNFLNQWKESLGVAPGGGGGGGGGGVNVEFFHATTVLFDASVNVFGNQITLFSEAVNKLADSTIELRLPTDININLNGLAGIQEGLAEFIKTAMITEIKNWKSTPNGLERSP